MRTYVSFRHPAQFVRLSDDDGVMSVEGAGWFVSLLTRVADLRVSEHLCQEDWGVVVFAERGQKKFWIGLNAEEEGAWLAHVHPGSWAWLQRWSATGKLELQRLLRDLHGVLASDAAISEISWYDEHDVMSRRQHGAATPSDP